MHKRITLAILALITIVIIMSMALTANGQCGSLEFKGSTHSRHFKAFGILIQPIKLIKTDTTTWSIDEMRKNTINWLPQYRFEAFVKNWYANPDFVDEVIQVRINVKGWKQDYTFNEFRKLIYEQ